MDNRLRLALVLHQHQPVGNLDSVNESVYRDAYQPLAESLALDTAPPVNLHTSGSLIDWLASRHPDHLLRLRDLAAAGRVEILGGAYHDPLLPLLPSADRRGQIERYARRAAHVFGCIPRGLWLPERIWEPSLAADLADCGIEHTVLDDFHFRAAGLTDAQLRGYYLTEAEGRLIAVFAGNERLRYLIPFAEPADTLDYLRDIARAHPGGTIVYADDAEKFGAWPGQRARMQNEHWLRRFFDALAAAQDWLHVTTLGECIDHVPPLGKLYVPEGSYREMRDFAALPRCFAAPFAAAADAEAGDVAGRVTHPVADVSARDASEPDGTWRNFRVKYPEVDEMYCRMLAVSRRCAAATNKLAVDAETDVTAPSAADATCAGNAQVSLVEQARDALYRSQCGCAYWHGVYGGVYLPHLRQAVYQNLIAAETLLDAADGGGAPLTAVIDDFNLDVHKEILLAGRELSLLVAPARGGMIYELDVKRAGTNLLATLARRPEPYHREYTAPAGRPQLSYDAYPRKSLLDHFFEPRATLDEVSSGSVRDQGDFVDGLYRARLRRVPGGMSLQLARRGLVRGRPLTVTKQLTIATDQSTIDIRYELTDLPPGEPQHFAVEFNFAGLPAGCADRYFVGADGRIVADLGQRLDLDGTTMLRLVDRWRGLDVRLSTSRAGGLWAFPIQTVSRSQRGPELIQQSVAVLPHWIVVGDANGRWSVDIELHIDASAATAAGAALLTDTAATTLAPPRGRSANAMSYTVDGPHQVAGPNHARQASAPFDSVDG